LLNGGGVGQFWLDGRGALRDKIESKSRARSWFELGAEFIVAPTPIFWASHHRVTEARPERSNLETAALIGRQSGTGAVIIQGLFCRNFSGDKVALRHK
jgi:hypothetical protein